MSSRENPRVRLLERKTQLAALADYAREAGSGQGRLVLLAGEAGVGKSSVVEQFEADLPTARWCWGGCDGLFTPRPLAPLHDIARSLGGDLDELCRAGAPREQLFTAMLAQISRPDGLTVCVIEDIHWADEATLDLLRFLGRRIRDARALIVVTYRDEALGQGDPLRKALGELATQRTTRRVSLPTLSADAVGQMVAGTEMAPADVFRLTGGNPFYLSEILRYGVGSGLGRGFGQLPSSARDAVLAPVSGLSAAARSVLDVSALIGSRIEPAFLSSVTHTGPVVIDELLASGVLLGDGEFLRFRHEIARLAVEQSIGVHRRGPIHQRILAGLLTAGCEDDARLAFHADGAADAEHVLTHAPRAGHRASEVASHREAAAQFERALRFVAAADDRTTATLYDAYCTELRVLDRWDEARDACERAIALWRKLGDPAREGQALIAYSSTLWRLCRGPESDQALERALVVLEPLGPSPEATAVLASLAASKGEQCDEEGIELAVRARELATTLGLTGIVCDTLNTEAWLIACRGGDWEGLMKQALELGLASDQHIDVGRAYTNMYTLYRAELRFTEGERYYVDGLAYCAEHEVSTFTNCLSGEVAGSMTQLGHWAEAEALAEDVLTRVSSALNRMVPMTATGRLRARQGRDGVWPRLDEAASSADGIVDPSYMQQVRIARAEARLLEGDSTGAAQEVELARRAVAKSSPMTRSEVAAWAHRVGASVPGLIESRDLVEPYASEVRGDWARAAELWEGLGCSYDAALVRLQSNDEAALREALGTFERLGAVAAERLTRQRMRDVGMKSVPAGARATTREHPAGLTRREREVLELICEGQTNEEISSQLFISVKTVDHHVSAVLGKLGVGSRKIAATEAVRLGLVGAPT